MNCGSGGRLDIGGGGYGQDRDGLIPWEDNVAHVTLGTDPIYLHAYNLGLETHYPIMSNLGNYRVPLCI